MILHRRASYDKKQILPCKSGTCVELNFYCCWATLSVLAAVVCVSTALILFAAVNMVCSLWKLPVEGSPRLKVLMMSNNLWSAHDVTILNYSTKRLSS